MRLSRLAILSLPLLCFVSGLRAEGQSSGKNVLFVFSAIQYSDETLKVMEPLIRDRIPEEVTFYHAFLDDPQIENKAYRESVAETLRQRYSAVKMDVVIACNPAAIHFVTEYRDKIFPGAPIVFVGITKRELGATEMVPWVTGVVSSINIRETIDLALRLQPDTKAVAIIAGATNWDRGYLATAHSDLAPYQDKVKLIDLAGTPDAQLAEKVAALPPHTVALFQVYPQFSDQPEFGTWDLLKETARRAPTYSAFPRLCVDGCIGGVYEDNLKVWTTAANLAIRVLSGERVEDSPIVKNSGFHVQVDWTALQRWHIPESAVPPGALILNRQPTLWEQGRKYFLAGIAIILVQGALILALFWQRARRRRSENELAFTNEELTLTNDRLRMAVEAGKSVGWDADLKKGKNRWFGDLQTMFGIQGDNRNGHIGDLRERVHPEDAETLDRATAAARENREPYALEFRVVRDDGEVRWVSANGKYYFTPSGEPDRMLGMATDVTERKLAEEALDSLSGQLIEAQEAERSRIAREIHDDFQQRLAMVSIDLEDVAQRLDGTNAAASSQLHQLLDRVGELATDLHSLSHRLHSSTLDSLGLVYALRAFCSEFQSYHSIEVNFVDENVPKNIPSDIALCLFRIAQEALQNVKKHSHADQAEVRIEGLGERIHLSISDSGAGFDAGHPLRKTGIGIRSMEERMRLVGGQLAIDSRPTEGTRIDAWAPIRGSSGVASDLDSGTARPDQMRDRSPNLPVCGE